MTLRIDEPIEEEVKTMAEAGKWVRILSDEVTRRRKLSKR